MDLADEAFKMAGALATVVVLLLGGLFVLRRLMGESRSPGGGSMIRLLGGLRLGQGKSIMLVEVAGEVLVLGSTVRDLTLLMRVAERERVDSLRSTSVHLFNQSGMWPLNFLSRSGPSSSAVHGKVEQA